MQTKIKQECLADEIFIRPATKNDIHEIIEMDSVVFKNIPLSRKLFEIEFDMKVNFFFVAEARGKLIGFSYGKHDSDNTLPRIMSLGVFRDFRKRGVGRELLKQAEKKLKDLGARCISLNVLVENSDAINLYESEGYEKLGTFRDPKGNMLKMTKTFF